MARITVEDCLDKIPNRFQLVLAATYRARMLSQGHAPKVEARNKPGVTALREIAAALVISVKTVDRHRANVLAKLGMRDRTELTRYAIRAGLIEP